MIDCRRTEAAIGRAGGVGAVLLLLLLVCNFLGGPLEAAEMTPEEEIGKRIYFEGRGGGAPFFAYFGRDDIRMPAVLLPCANCHGHDGLGRPEGGVEPPAIIWSHLTKAYGHRHPDGRTHGPFDEESVIGAIAGGTDPDGNAIDPLMPRYEMEPSDFQALIAFLKRLETQLDPGLSDATIRIGTLAPRSGSLEIFGAAITGVLDAYFAALNESGGIYDRQVELVVAERSSDLDTTLENLRRLIEDEAVFAVVGGFAAGMEREIFEILQDHDVPNLGMITLLPLPSGIDDGNAFLTTASVAEQAQALVAHLADVGKGSLGPVAILHSDLANIETVVQAVARESAGRGLPKPFELVIGGGKGVLEQAVAEMSRSGIAAVIYLGSDELLTAFGAASAETSWRPAVLVSGPLNARAATDLPLEFKGRVFAAYPTLPSDRSSSGIRELEGLQKASGLGRDHLATQISALAAAKVLVEGLRRSGRALSHEKFVKSLESLSKFETGLTPPISFGPAKRVGSSGAYVIEVDLEQHGFAAAPVWYEVD